MNVAALLLLFIPLFGAGYSVYCRFVGAVSDSSSLFMGIGESSRPVAEITERCS